MFAKPQAIVETTNQGFKVILKEVHFAPIVTIQAFVNVGSADEPKDYYGAAHFFEHLIFKGTRSRKVGEIAQEVEAAGGHINAYTSFDQTVFYLTLSSDKVHLGLDILADAMIHHHIPEVELEREREVVLEEIRRSADLPAQVAGKLLFETSFKKHPYGRPILGFEPTLKGMSLKEIRGFYNNFYTSKNISLVVVGDFDSKSLLPVIKKKFSFKNTSQTRRMKRPSEPTLTAPRYRFEEMPLQESYCFLSFPIPGVRHPDIPALDILSSLMGGDETSWLHRECISEKDPVANSVFTHCYTPRDPGLFVVGGTFPPEKVAEALPRISTILQKTISEPPRDGELQRIKDSLLAEKIYEKETVEGIARNLGFYQFYFDDISAEDHYYRTMEGLTTEDVVQAARTYLKPNKYTISYLGNSEFKGKQTRGAFFNQINKALETPKSKTKVSVPKVATPETHEIVHRYGTSRLVVQRLGHLPLASVRWAQMGGLRLESPHQNGISQLFSSVWTKGSSNYSYMEILERLKSYGGSMSAFSEKTRSELDLMSQVAISTIP